MKNLEAWLVPQDTPVLRKVCQKVPLPLSEADKEIMDKLITYVTWSRDPSLNEGLCKRPAVGIAANQIGENKRMFYIRFRDYEHNLIEHAVINAEIVQRSEQKMVITSGEGCLSVPVEGEHQFFGISQRNYEVTVTGYDYFAKKERVWNVKGFEAIVFQHETDHLNGKLFLDRISKTKPEYIDPAWKTIPKIKRD